MPLQPLHPYDDLPHPNPSTTPKFGQKYCPGLRFSPTDTEGVLKGFVNYPWSHKQGHGWIPDTVVDVSAERNLCNRKRMRHSQRSRSHACTFAALLPTCEGQFEDSADGKSYDWVLELQCVEKLGHVEFVGINFYSQQQNPGQAYIDGMIKRARAKGLGVYLDAKPFKTTIVPQTNCTA